MKKRSNSSSSSALCSSSSTSCVESVPKTEQPKRKRVKRNASNNSEKSQSGDTGSSTLRRSSIYRGVTRHRWTGRYEAHLWDKSSINSRNKKGRQVYLGAYDNEEAAARTYDRAAIKYWGPQTILNFSIDNYQNEIIEMERLSREEYLASLRRQSSGFSRGVSQYRGVARHHHNGRWEARIGRVKGNKYLYLGTYKTQEEAATAYDIAAIRYRGENAVTNFDISNYIAREEILPAPASPPPAPPELVIGRKSISVGGIMLPKKEEEGKDDKGAVLPPPLPPSPPPLLAPLPPKQEPQQYQVQEMMKPQVNPQDVPPMMETHSMMPMMDGTNDHHHDEHGHDPWDQYLHAGFNSLPIPDFFFMDPKPAELPNVFDDISFDQDIDKLFEGGPDDMSFMFDKSSTTNEVEADVPTSIEEKKANNKDRSCSPPTSISSDSSTTTKAF